MKRDYQRYDNKLMRCRCNRIAKVKYIKHRKDSCDYVLQCRVCKKPTMKNLKVIKDKNGEVTHQVTNIKENSLKWKELIMEMKMGLIV